MHEPIRMDTAREYTAHLADLLRRERGAMADFILSLAAFDSRRLWVELGHGTLFSFLRRELGLSAGAAQYRKTAAELVQRFPEVEAALRSGQLCLSSLIELAKVIAPGNVAEVLPRFFGLSSREAAFVAASIRPASHVPRRDVVTMAEPVGSIPAAPTAPHVGPEHGEPAPRAADRRQGAAVIQFRAPETAAWMTQPTRHPEAGNTPSLKPSKPSVEPLDAKHVRLHLTVSREFYAKLERAKDALSHARPGASIEEILEAGLELVLAQHAKRRGLVAKPRKTARPAKNDRIAAAVKRDVWQRAGGRCEWPLDAGGVCGSTHQLEYAHVVAKARGGPPTRENLKLHCRAHNVLTARRDFGDAVVDRYVRKRGSARERPPPLPRSGKA
jgi:hypothetical protein